MTFIPPPSLPLAGSPPNMTGPIMLEDGSATAPSLTIHATNTGMFYETADPSGTLRPIAFAVAGNYMVGISATGLNIQGAPGAGAQVSVKSEGAATNSVERVTGSSLGPTYILSKSRGSVATPAIIQTNDLEGTFQFRGGGSVSGQTISYVVGANIVGTCIDTTPSATAMGSQLTFSACAIGSISLTEIARLSTASGLSMFGANPVIDQNRTIIHRSYTVTTLPTAVTGGVVYASNLGGGAACVQSDGTNWFRMGSQGYETVGDADNTFTYLTNAGIQEETVVLTANRTTTLSDTDSMSATVKKGAVYTFIRSGLGAFTRTFKDGAGATLYTSASLTAETISFVFNGTAWRLMQHSLL